ncbi:hypothetical protein MMC28_011663 [Mycoblastus sanguinarius]|nr:hypothetical protein [Mycoblastus sanguinarius]
MWAPEQCLPPLLPKATIIDLLTSIGLPKPLRVHRLDTRAAYHSVYMLSLPPDAFGVSKDKDSADQTTDLVLRVSGQHFPSIKTINEAAVISWVEANTSIPVPTVVRMSGSRENVLQHEYLIHRRLPGDPLDEAFRSVTQDQMDTILNQIIDMLVVLHSTTWQHIGGLRFTDDGNIVPGPVLEEGAWQVPEILTHFGSSQTFDSLNIAGPYPDYVSYISAHVVKHLHAIDHHISLGWMRDLIPQLNRFLLAIRRDEAELNNVKLRLSHSDIHFSNIMIDPSTARITGLLDWEFSGVVPYCRWDPMTHFLSNLGIEDAVERKGNIAELCQRFETLCRARGVGYLLEDAKYTSTKQESMQLATSYLQLIVKRCPQNESLETLREYRLTLEKHLEVCIAQS